MLQVLQVHSQRGVACETNVLYVWIQFKVQSLIDEAQVSTIHICETSKHTSFEILLQRLNGVVPIKSRVGWSGSRNSSPPWFSRMWSSTED